MRKDHKLSLAQPWAQHPSKASIRQLLYTPRLEHTLWSRALDSCSQVIQTLFGEQHLTAQMVVMEVMVSRGPALEWPRH